MQSNPLWPVKTSFPLMEKNMKCDVVVVGAGIAGISSAYHLSKKGYDVIVLEEDEIGSGATGASSGTLYPSSGLDITSSIELFGIKNAKNLWNEANKSIKDIASLVKKYSIECGFRNPGTISVAKTQEDVDVIKKNSKNLKKIGFKQKLITSSEIKDFFSAGNFLSGLMEPCAQIRPAHFIHGLAKTFDLRVFQKTPMVSIEEGLVKTPNASIKCSDVVVATNLKPFFGLEQHFYTENTVIVASQKMKENIKKLWKEEKILWTVDERYDILYSQDDRAMLDLFEYKGIDDKINLYYPGSGFRKEHVYGDSWSQTKDTLPIVGEIQRNIYAAIAMGEQGIVMGFTSGRKIPKLLENKKDTFLNMASHKRFLRANYNEPNK